MQVNHRGHWTLNMSVQLFCHYSPDSSTIKLMVANYGQSKLYDSNLQRQSFEKVSKIIIYRKYAKIVSFLKFLNVWGQIEPQVMKHKDAS